MRLIGVKNLNKVIIESDCIGLVKAIQNKEKDYSYTGRIIADSLVLLNSMSDISFSWARRNANECAHRLARSTLDNNGIGEWVD